MASEVGQADSGRQKRNHRFSLFELEAGFGEIHFEDIGFPCVPGVYPGIHFLVHPPGQPASAAAIR